MAYADYILCDSCGSKFLYDGYDELHNNFVIRYGENYEVRCPDCVTNLRAKLEEKDAMLERERAMLDWSIKHGVLEVKVPAKHMGNSKPLHAIEITTGDYGEEQYYVEVIDNDMRKTIGKAMSEEG